MGAALDTAQNASCQANKNTSCQAIAIKSQSQSQCQSQSESQSRIKVFHKKDQWRTYFNACKDSNKLVVIDFTATWCGPCRSMKPTLKECSEKYTDVDFVEIDVDELPDVASEFGVQAMPTFLFMKNGDQVDKVVGARKEDLQKKIEKHRKSNLLT